MNASGWSKTKTATVPGGAGVVDTTPA
ncbi:hypothetical protein GA0115260_1117813, partial [Streptomyces sp. MnatMP-M27]